MYKAQKNCIKHIFSQATPLWPDGLPISQRAQMRIGALRRIGHSLFRVAIRSKHHPRHAKHSGAILTNRLHKALVAPSLVLHIHPSFRFLRIAIHRKDARDAKKSASQSVQYFQMDACLIRRSIRSPLCPLRSNRKDRRISGASQPISKGTRQFTEPLSRFIFYIHQSLSKKRMLRKFRICSFAIHQKIAFPVHTRKAIGGELGI